MIVYLARVIPAFVMYCVNGASPSSLLIESTDMREICVLYIYICVLYICVLYVYYIYIYILKYLITMSGGQKCPDLGESG